MSDDLPAKLRQAKTENDGRFQLEAGIYLERALKAEAQASRYREALRDIERNYDCDDSPYQSHIAVCRCCKARKALEDER